MTSGPSTGTLNKANAVVHAVSALYVVALAFALWVVAPATHFSPAWTLILVSAAAVFVVLDLRAAIEQWRSGAGQIRSIALHLIFLLVVSATIAYQYDQVRPESLLQWFEASNFWFVALLAAVRMIMGAALGAQSAAAPRQ